MDENISANISAKFKLDPRTLFLLLIIANVIMFSGAEGFVLYGFLFFLSVLLILASCQRVLITFAILFVILVGLQYFVFPIAPKFIVLAFSIFVNYTYKMFPCLMAGALIIKTISLYETILAMRKCHFPQQVIIPISVTIRYFPAIIEEITHIRDAMKLREIPLSEKLECIVVPLMMSATSTIEELSAAAVTRGIENPVKKTSIVQLRLKLRDYVCFGIGFAILLSTFI